LRTFRKPVEEISKNGFSWNLIFKDISKTCRGNVKGRIFMKFDIWGHFENLSRKFQKDGFSWNVIFEDISLICRGNFKGRIFMKFDIGGHFEKSIEEILIYIKIWQKLLTFYMETFVNLRSIVATLYLEWGMFRQNLCNRKHTFCIQ
jgi:hypothetical protein